MANAEGTRQRRWLQEALASDPYHFLHSRLSSGIEPLRRIRLRIDELDDIATIELALPGGDRLISLEARRDGRLLLPVLTDVDESSGQGEVTAQDNGSVLADVTGVLTPAGASAQTSIRAKLWNSFKWEQAMSPYTLADWSLTFGFDSADVRTELTLDIPQTYGPASLQGNYLLAHPSQREGARKLVRLMYGAGGLVSITGRITKTAASPDVWVSLAKGALLLTFGVVLSLFSSRALSGHQTELLLSAVAGLGAFGATELGLMESSVYLSSARPLRLLQACAVSLTIGLYAWISVELFLAHSVSMVTRAILITVAVVLVVMALGGIMLHRTGYWSGYLCDICREPIGLRRGHRECFVTGRVPCQADIDRMCSKCPHFTDLGVQNLTTLERYDPLLLPCAAEQRDIASHKAPPQA